MRLSQLSERRREAVRSGAANAGAEQRAFRNVDRGPRRPLALRGRHASGAFYLIHVAPAHAGLREPLPTCALALTKSDVDLRK